MRIRILRRQHERVKQLNQFVKEVMEHRIKRTIQNLQSNQMGAWYIKDRTELLEKVKEFLCDGDIVSWGGSQTLLDTGVLDLLKSGKYLFYDRAQPNLPPETVQEYTRKAFTADVFFSGSNAVTEDGELYNVDGIGNRVAPLIFGPKKVVIVVGTNKIVKNLVQAEQRLKAVAAPANAIRLERGTPCTRTGQCENCSSPNRICCATVILAQQREPERVNVLILDEEVGF